MPMYKKQLNVNLKSRVSYCKCYPMAIIEKARGIEKLKNIKNH